MNRTATKLAVFLATLAPVAAFAAPPANALVEREGPDALQINWSSPDPVDVFVADGTNVPLATATLISARDGDGHASLAHAGLSRRYFTLRNVRTGEVTHVAERLVPLETGSNFRDIGGYPAANGKHVRWGMVYRSGGTPLLNGADVERIGQLHLANMVDLRSDEERVLAPSRIDGVTYTAFGYSFAGLGVSSSMETTYRTLPTMLAPQLKQIFAKLLRAEQPLVYNCSAGQDRTGFVTAMILSALGTPRDTITTDYHLSTKFRRPENEMPRVDPALYPGNAAVAVFARYQDNPAARQPQPLKTAEGKAYLDFAFAEIEAKWGSTGNYLAREIGLTPAMISSLRKAYTE